MNQSQKLMAALFTAIVFSAIPVRTVLGQDKGTKTSSIPVSTVVTQEKAKGAKTILDTLYNVAHSLQGHLRSQLDSKGIQKSEARLRADNETADRIHDIAVHYDPDLLMAVVFDAAQKQPDAELDDVIRAYLHAELDRQKAPPASKPHPPPPARQ